MFTSFDEIYPKVANLLSSEVSIHGRLIVSDKAYLANDSEGFQRRERIELIDEGAIADELLQQLPAYGGGYCIFDEEVWLTGVIERNDDTFRIVSISQCKVRRDDKEITINVSADTSEPM